MSCNPIEVACCFDEKMYVGACALIRSIAAYCRTDRDLILHVVVQEGYRPDLSFAAALPVDLRLHAVENNHFARPGTDLLTVATYFRLLLPEILPDTKKVIYLDCDTIVLRELDMLFDIALERQPLAAMLDHFLINQTVASGIPHGDHSIDAGFYAERFAGTSLKDYFNSGVLLLNLDVWRQERIKERCLDWIRRWPATRFADQDALNAVVKDFARLDCRWNAFASAVEKEDDLHDDPEWRLVVDQWLSDPWIVHFAGAEKPWHGAPANRFDRLFWQYAGRSHPPGTAKSAATASDAVGLPLVSIIIVNYNYGKYLRKCIESALLQNYPAIECIVVDNASTDFSHVELEALKNAYREGLKVRYNDRNLGQGLASRIGFHLSRGTHIVFLDADDYLLPNAVKTHIYAHLASPSAVGFTSGDMLQVEDERVVLGTYFEAAYARRRSSTHRLPKERLRSVDSVSRSSARMFAGLADIGLLQVSEKTTDWVWSPTSGNLYRRDAVSMFIDAAGIPDLRSNFDAFLNFGINAFSGSILIDRPLAGYRLHGNNVFSRGVSLRNFIGHKHGADTGSFAAFCALRHVAENFDTFAGSSLGVLEVDRAIKVLRKKAADHPGKWRRFRAIANAAVLIATRRHIRALDKLYGPSARYPHPGEAPVNAHADKPRVLLEGGGKRPGPAAWRTFLAIRRRQDL